MVADGRVDQPKVVQLVLQEVLADLKQRYFCISGTNTWRNFRKLGQHSQNPSIFAFCKLFPPIPTCMIRTQSAERCASSCLELRSPHLRSADSPLLYCEQLQAGRRGFCWLRMFSFPSFVLFLVFASASRAQEELVMKHICQAYQIFIMGLHHRKL